MQMILIRTTVISLLVAGSLASCAAARDVRPTPKGETTITGWIQFRREFRLYEHKSDVGKIYGELCTSGYAESIKKQAAAARKFNGKYVTVTGTLLNYTDYAPTPFSGLIDNYCNRSHILIAHEIKLRSNVANAHLDRH